MKAEKSIIWMHHLPMQINGGVQNGIVVQNLDTGNVYSVETIQK